MPPEPHSPAATPEPSAVEQFDLAKETIAATLASLSWRDLRAALSEGRDTYELTPNYPHSVGQHLRAARDMLASAVRELDKAMRLAGIDPEAL